MEKLDIQRSADFSPCRTWRYTLKRVWDDSKPIVLFILLNPSTADEVHDDPTNRRGIGYAMDWDFGGVTFCNLFAVRTPDPKMMKRAKDPIGPKNDYWIAKQAKVSKQIVLAWGANGDFMDRDLDVRIVLRKVKRLVWCMGCTRQGHPKHILYLPRTLKPVRYRDGLMKVMKGGSGNGA